VSAALITLGHTPGRPCPVVLSAGASASTSEDARAHIVRFSMQARASSLVLAEVTLLPRSTAGL